MIYAIKGDFPNLANSGELLLMGKKNLIIILIKPGLKYEITKGSLI